MYNEEQPARRFYAVSHEHDLASFAVGSLIPPQRSTPPVVVVSWWDHPQMGTLLAIVGALALALIGTQTTVGPDAARLLASVSSSATPVTAPVVVESPYTNERTPLNYGVQGIFAQPTFFNDTREAFIAAEQTFVEVHLPRQQIRYFEAGVLQAQYPIQAQAPVGSWCETPAGLYQVDFKREQHFSTFGQVYQPWSIGFQGNYFIHGWPEYGPDEPVEGTYEGACIRLASADAEALYQVIEVGTPIMVYAAMTPSDTFVYQPKIPTIDTPHYLIADVESNTILASSDLDAVASIASLTKLMTALVATEYINLDTNVSVTQPTFVQSLIPRLGDRNRVSMYSLLQLLLVESSNEAAEVIAAQLGREAFIAKMNELAVSIGMLDTTFADPSGLSADNQSSVRDLFQLTQYIYKHRRFIMDMTADQNIPTVYVSGEFGELLNFNKVDALENFIGGKIGETRAAGQTSVTLHQLEVAGSQRTLAVVILGSDSRDADVRELLEYAQERFGE